MRGNPRIQLSCEEATEAGTMLLKEGVAVLLLGRNGAGKTDIAREIVKRRAIEEKGEEPIDSSVERPHDGSPTYTFINISAKGNEEVMFPNFVRGDEGTVYQTIAASFLAGADHTWGPKDLIHNTLLLDEVAKEEEHFKSISSIINEGRLGDAWIKPDGMRIVATGNRVEDNAGSVDLQSDLVSRACIIEVSNDTQSWLNFHAGELDPLIMSCARAFGDDWLFTQHAKGSEEGQPFNCARQAKRLSDLMIADAIDLDTNLGRGIAEGFIGIHAGAELFAMHKAMSRLGDIDAMIDDPDAHASEIEQIRNNVTHNGRQTLCAMTAMLAKRVKRDPAVVNKLFPFMRLFGEEMEVTFAHMAKAVNEDITKEVAWGRHLRDCGDFHF